MEYKCYYPSMVGGLMLTSDGRALSGLSFVTKEDESVLSENDRNICPVFTETIKWLDIYFEGKAPDFTPPLSMNTTPFRKAVWDIMLSIPYGKTITYGEIAARIAKARGLPRMSAQAVGGAVGHNAIAIIIPCHRVIGANGNIGGYSAGIDKKVKLLRLEGHDMEGKFGLNISKE